MDNESPTIPLDRAFNSLPANTAEKLRYELIRVQIETLRAQIDAHVREEKEFEKRLRITEDGITKFNFIVYLTMGGGLLGLINLLVLLYTIARAITP
jgi:hypothetical protein